VALRFNFGSDRPFSFDLDAFEESHLVRWRRAASPPATAEPVCFEPPTLSVLLVKSMMQPPTRLGDGEYLVRGDEGDDEEEEEGGGSYLPSYLYRESSHRLATLPVTVLDQRESTATQPPFTRSPVCVE